MKVGKTDSIYVAMWKPLSVLPEDFLVLWGHPSANPHPYSVNRPHKLIGSQGEPWWKGTVACHQDLRRKSY